MLLAIICLQVDILQHREEQIKAADVRASALQQQVERLQAELHQQAEDISKLKVREMELLAVMGSDWFVLLPKIKAIIGLKVSETFLTNHVRTNPAATFSM